MMKAKALEIVKLYPFVDEYKFTPDKVAIRVERNNHRN